MSELQPNRQEEAPERGGPRILAIESSCDETAAAVLDGTRSVLSSAVHSQVELHAVYGGVVPELASRSHIVMIDPVVQQALEQADTTLDQIQGIAVTQGPGLKGSLLVGVEYARALAWTHDIPLQAIHHLEGHLFAPFAALADGSAEPGWPFIGLVVSGGHTSIYHAIAPGHYEELGRTLDDAAGEAFDKVSKKLGLGYPGGAIIDRLATQGNASALNFPRPMLHAKDYHFSFSGIKTSVATAIDKEPTLPQEERLADFAASFQRAVVEVLVHKTLRAAQDVGVKKVVLTGGVAANSELRETLRCEAAAVGCELVFPPRSLCTDNAVMIGAAAYAPLWRRIVRGDRFAEMQLAARASWPLGRRSRFQKAHRS